jgi:hypothetical protein
MDFLIKLAEGIRDNWVTIVSVTAYIITGASVIVKLTPSPKDDLFLAKLLKLLKVLSLNKEK